MDINRVWQINFLENTRLIYAGIKMLYSSIKNDMPDDLAMEKRHEILENAADQTWKQHRPEPPVETQERFQHPLHLFFRFLYNEKMGNTSQFISEISDMLMLYDAVEQLRKQPRSRKEYPQYFTRLCNCIRDMFESDMCYLLYSQRDQSTLLCTSDLVAQESFQPLRKKEFDHIRNTIEQKRRAQTKQIDEQLLGNTILFDGKDGLKIIPGKNLLVLILNFPRYPYEDWKHEWFYIVLHSETHDYTLDNQASRIPNILIRLRNLLFLRQHIFEQCQSKMYILLMAQRSYQYILGQSEDRRCRILHLTDLHIDEKKYDKAEALLDAIPQLTRTEPIDLIVITGDVVQGQRSASSLEKNYRLAKTFLRKLAFQIWRVDDTHVRSDWQKRIVIVPGNHDYAAMNELEATSAMITGRMTGGGHPALNEGGPMAKFAYYIDFLRDLLDCDINELIQNNLNEVRYYSELNLRICVMNTVAGAGPLRNNKVWIDEKSVLSLLGNCERNESVQLLLGHHLPCYAPNYLMDRYYFRLKGGTSPELSTQQKWFDEFHNHLSKIHEKRDDLSDDISDELQALYNIIEEKIHSSSSQKDNILDFMIGRDISRTLSDIQTYHLYTEQIATLYSSVQGDWEMAQQDTQAMRNAYQQILNRFHASFLLGGHTHAYRYYDDVTDNSPVDQRLHIPGVEGGLLVTGNSLNFGTLSITEKQLVWNQYVYDRSLKKIQKTDVKTIDVKNS